MARYKKPLANNSDTHSSITINNDSRQIQIQHATLGYFGQTLFDENNVIHQWVIQFVNQFKLYCGSLRTFAAIKAISPQGAYLEYGTLDENELPFDETHFVYKSTGCQCIEESTYRFHLLRYCSISQNFIDEHPDGVVLFVAGLENRQFTASILPLAGNVGGKLIVPYYDDHPPNFNPDNPYYSRLILVHVDETIESIFERMNQQ